MKQLDRLDLISTIGRELQSRMSYKDIDVYLSGFGINCKKETSGINSKWVYVKELLADEKNEIILKIAEELEIKHSYSLNSRLKNASEIYPVKIFPNGDLAIECGFCEGKGVFPETPLDDVVSCVPCPVCNGKGLNIFSEKIENIVECRLCDKSGKGWNENGHFLGDICQVCNGKGILVIEKASDNDSFWNQLHPKITSVAQTRFESNHFSDAVEAAFKEINTLVKKIVKRKKGEEVDGVPLMQKAFSPKSPIIKLGDLTTETGRNIQQGYMFLYSGAMMGIRNPKAHENITINRNSSIHFLYLASLLMMKLEEGI